jgi:hypothetical protein
MPTSEHKPYGAIPTLLASPKPENACGTSGDMRTHWGTSGDARGRHVPGAKTVANGCLEAVYEVSAFAETAGDIFGSGFRGPEGTSGDAGRTRRWGLHLATDLDGFRRTSGRSGVNPGALQGEFDLNISLHSSTARDYTAAQEKP